MKIGFGLLGRTFGMHDKPDAPSAHDARLLLERLADRHPSHEFVVFSPSRETPTARDNVSSPWDNVGVTSSQARWTAIEALADCHLAVVFLNSPPPVSINTCPKLRGKGDVTPLVSSSRVAPTIRAINAWMDVDPRERDVIYVVNDSRSKLVCRDLKWPPRGPIIAQFDFTRWQRHFRFGDSREPEYWGYDRNKVVRERSHWMVVQEYKAADLPHLVL